MKRRLETPILMSVVEFIIKGQPIVLSLTPVDASTWSCSTVGIRFFHSRGKTFPPSTKAVLSIFRYCNGRIPVGGVEFALALAVDRLNNMCDKDGTLPDEIAVSDLTDVVKVCDGYLDLMQEHAIDIKRLEEELRDTKRR